MTGGDLGGDGVGGDGAGSGSANVGGAGGGSASGGLVKCLVWDLDDTLWRGTLAEGDAPVLDERVRAAIVELDARGVLQSVASRNDPEPALAALEALGVAEYFVLPEIGWGAKSAAVARIADRLGFAHRAIAFVDDRPAERAEVAFHLPEVRCYPAERVLELCSLPEFSPAVVTEDARNRRALYRAGFARGAEQAAFTGPDEEFLRSLGLVLRIGRAQPEDLHRVEELTARTSQMNATGVHYPHGELRALLDDPAHEVLVASLTDRFGPHGAIGIVLLERHTTAWHLKLLATSCRVVPYGVGSVLLDWLSGQALDAGAHLVADFRRTDRNRMMEIAYRFAGYDDADCACRAELAAMSGDPRNPAAENPAAGPLAAGAPAVQGSASRSAAATVPEARAAANPVRRLHLLPVPRPAPRAVTVEAPSLLEVPARG
ncbi:methoxymalonate biosynthesis protein [Actinosynnema pretiosum]|nr:methoxymalonate biosynthesis protein [Actinosynnema pretiosum]